MRLDAAASRNASLLPHLKKAAAKFNVTILARKTKIEGKADGLIKKGAWTQAQKVEFFNGVRAGEEFKAFELETTGMQAEWTTALRTFERTYKTDATQACEAGDKVRKLDKKLKSTQMEQFGLYEKSLKPLLKKVKKGSASLVQADGSREFLRVCTTLSRSRAWLVSPPANQPGALAKLKCLAGGDSNGPY